MNTSIIHAVDNFAIFIGLVWVLVILVGVIKSLRSFLILQLGDKSKKISTDTIRYFLGTHLLLGLEFLVAADIVETVFKPSLEQLLILGGIVIIRTVLNYFLNKELEHIKKEIE